MWIDLEAVGDDRVWGDGTIYEDTAISQTARLIQNSRSPVTAFRVRRDIHAIDDTSQSNRHLPLCQANPRGIEW